MNNSYSVEAILKATGADKFASDFEKAQKSLGGMTGATKKSAGGLKNLAVGIAKVAGGIGVTKLLSAGFNAIRNSVDGAVSRVDTLNQFPKVLEQMGASGEDADRSIARLSEGIQGLPTTLDGVAGTAQRMFTILGDIDLATESTLAMNNAFLASGASQADASRGLEQYTQMLSAGKVDMQSWRTLQETMPYALKETAEAFGFTGQSATNDFYAALMDGEVTMNEMNEKIIELSTETGGFAETSLEASKGLATSWQNIKTAVVTGTANAIQAINGWMEDSGLGGIAENFDKVKVAVQGAFKYIVENIPTVLNGITGLFDTVKNSTAFQTLKEVIGDVIEIGKELISAFLESEAWANFKSLAKDIAQAILDIDFRTVISQVGEFLDKWSPLIIGIMAGIVAFKTLVPLIIAVQKISRVVTGFKLAIGAFGGLTKAGAVLIPILTGISWPIMGIIAAVVGVVAAGVALWKNWDTIKEKAQQLGDKISEVWNNIKTWMSDLDKNTATAFSNMGRSIESSLTDSDNIVLKKIGSIVGNITDNFDHAYGETGNIFSAIKETISMSMSDADLAVATSMSDIGRNIESSLTESDNVVLQKMGSIVGNITDNFDHAYSETGNIFEAIKMTISMTFQNMVEVVKAKASEIWNSITEWFGGLPAWFSNTWNSIVESVTEWVANMIEKAIEVGTQFIENITAFFSELPYNVGFFLGEVIGTVIQWGIDMWNKAKETGSNFIEAITTFFSELPGRVSDFLTTTWTNVTTWASDMWTKAKETGANFINNIVEWFSQLPGKVGGYLSEVWNRITTWATNMWNKAKETGTKFINNIVEWFKQLPGKIGDFLSKAWTSVATWATNMWNKAKETGSNFVNGIVTWFQQLPSRIQTWLTSTISRVTTWASDMGNKGREAGADLLNKAVNAVKGLPGKMATAGANVVKGFWKGITNLGGWIKDKVGGFFTGIVDGIKSKLKIFSPSRVFRDEIGKMIVKGFGQGIDHNGKEAINPMNRMLDNVIGVFDSQTSGLGATFSVTGEGNIASAMNRALDVDMPMVNGQISHEMNNNLSTQPAHINLNIGGQVFTAFVENIQSESDRQLHLDMI